MESPLLYQHFHDVGAKEFLYGAEKMTVAAAAAAAAKLSPTVPRKKKTQLRLVKRTYSVPQVSSMYLYYDTSARSDQITIAKIWRMVHDLRELDATWRGSLSARPNANEQCLYMLILAHVCSDIFLSHHENILKLPHPPQDEVEWIVKEVRRRASAFGATSTGGSLNIGCEKEDADLTSKEEDTFDDFCDSWQSVDLLIDEMLQCRDSICALPRESIGEDLELSQLTEIGTFVGDAEAKRAKETPLSAWREIDGGQSMDMKLDGGEADAKGVKNLEESTDRKISEHTLRSILCGLACRRKERSYAPPVGEELTCYRHIRKWISSTLSFIYAKDVWLKSWGDWWEEAEQANDFATQRMQIGKDWQYVYDSAAFIHPLFHVPWGHNVAVIFDELSEFRSLLTDWKKRFSDICIARFSGERSADLFKMDGVVNGRKRAQVQQGGNAKKKMKRDPVEVADGSCKPPGNDKPVTKHSTVYLDVLNAREVAAHSCIHSPGNDKTMIDNFISFLNAVDAIGVAAAPQVRKTGSDRIKYLNDIFTIFGAIGFVSCSPTTTELRLYYRILEHVRSSIWLFHAKEPTEETAWKLDEESTGVPKTSSWEQSTREYYLKEPKSREDYLQEIVCMIEEIESVFELPHVSRAEMVLYEKILKHIYKDLGQSSYYMKHEADGGIEHPDITSKVALARRVLKTTSEWQEQLATGLEKEIGDTLGMIFTKSPPKECKTTEWLLEHIEEAGSDLKDLATEGPGGLELFDQLLLSVIEVQKLFAILLRKFSFAKRSAYGVYNVKELYQIALMEGWSALRVLEESGGLVCSASAQGVRPI